MKSFYFFFFLALISVGMGSVNEAQAADLQTFIPNQRGVQALKKNDLNLAQRKFSDALAKDPLNSDVQMNLGLSFLQSAQMEKAQAAFETVRKHSLESESLFAANYNLGWMMQKSQNVDKALQYYQEALKHNPDSTETKTNIELLTQEKQSKGGGQGEPKEEQKDSQGQSDQENQEEKDQKSKSPKEKEGRQYGKNKKQPQPFKSENLTQGDVNKILDELKRQEQRVRAEYNKKEQKEVPRDKDW